MLLGCPATRDSLVLPARSSSNSFRYIQSIPIVITGSSHFGPKTLRQRTERYGAARQEGNEGRASQPGGFSCSKLFIVVRAPLPVTRMALCMDRAAVT